MSRVVLFCGEDESALLLSDVRRTSDGTVKSGYVENGGWNFEYRDGELLAKAGNLIVNRYPTTNFREVRVPADLKGDYNAVIEWARTQPVPAIQGQGEPHDEECGFEP